MVFKTAKNLDYLNQLKNYKQYKTAINSYFIIKWN